MEKKFIKRLLIVVLSTFIFLLLCLFGLQKYIVYKENIIVEKKIDEIKMHYNSGVITTKECDLYSDGDVIGSVSKGTILNLKDKEIEDENDIYFELDNLGYSVKYDCVEKTDEEKQKNIKDYVDYGLKVVTKTDYTLYNDFCTYKFKLSDVYTVKAVSEKYYEVLFDDEIFYLDKDYVESTEEYSVDNLASSVPVLNYHFFYFDDIGGCDQIICESVTRFRSHLDYMKENGFKTLTINEFVRWMYGEIELPNKSVLITVDDGAMGTSTINGNALIPILEEYKMNATLFLITAWWNKENYESDYLDVQSHGNDLHTYVSGRAKGLSMSYNDLLNDLTTSLSLVESNDSFAYPFYSYNKNFINSVRDSGIKVAFVGGNKKATRSDNKYLIPRYPIYDNQSLDKIISFLN